MCGQDRCVIGFGAGSIIRPLNQQFATVDALIVYLQASPDILWERAKTDSDSEKNRPNLIGGGYKEVVETLKKREPVYRRCANLLLDATAPPEILAKRILNNLSTS